jgi:YVTN family beta-propeller protein
VGANPNGLAVSADGKRLYVADAGNNDIAVLAVGTKRDRRLGYIPTGWYPTGVVLDPAGKRLYVANAKGLGAGPNPGGPNPTKDPSSPPSQYVGSMIKGARRAD